ncbi:MAG: hypothetical protein AAB250_16180, partial [Bdellovibrionota bacterium]
LPPRGGKSTLALECLRNEFDVLGDEIVLVRSQRVHAFPIRIAVAATVARQFSAHSREFSRKTFDRKSLLSFEKRKGEPLELGTLVFQSKPGIATEVAPASAFNSLEWVAWTCLGLGLPQMREFILRLEELPWVIVVALRRLGFALKFLSTRRLLVSRTLVTGDPAGLMPRLAWVRSSIETVRVHEAPILRRSESSETT